MHTKPKAASQASSQMVWLLLLATGLGLVWLAGACTIDPVARAEIAGEVTGDGIFQRAGTSDQVSYQVTLAGADGSYHVYLGDGECRGGDAIARWAEAGAVVVAAG